MKYAIFFVAWYFTIVLQTFYAWGNSLNATISNVTNVSCFGDSNGIVHLNVTGGTAPYNYNWSNGTHDSLLSGITAGPY